MKLECIKDFYGAGHKRFFHKGRIYLAESFETYWMLTDEYGKYRMLNKNARNYRHFKELPEEASIEAKPKEDCLEAGLEVIQDKFSEEMLNNMKAMNKKITLIVSMLEYQNSAEGISDVMEKCNEIHRQKIIREHERQQGLSGKGQPNRRREPRTRNFMIQDQKDRKEKRK